MMKRIVGIIPLVLLVAGLCGCANVVSLGPGGALPGALYTDTTYPNSLNPNMRYRITFDSEDIERLGTVEAESVSRNILYLFGTGDSGFGKLLAEAREKGADGVMNVTVDTKYTNVLFFYSTVTTKLRGEAYRYK